MRPQLIYGLLIAAAGFFMSSLLSLLGLHSDASRLGTAQFISTVWSLATVVTGLWLGIRAVRAAAPQDAPFTYGQAAGAGAMISLWNALFSTIGFLIFMKVIDPGFGEVIVQAQMDKMAARGISPEKAEPMIHFVTSLPIMAIFTCVSIFIMTLVVGLIVAIFIRREAPREAPVPVG